MCICNCIARFANLGDGRRLPNSVLDSKFDFSTKKQDIKTIFYKSDSGSFALFNGIDLRKVICLNIRVA